uniref:Uncharacterized protein n=1 Tax=Knipowitschia caucasica TaxID=637954 RepID=A0AAV2L079_KNICA
MWKRRSLLRAAVNERLAAAAEEIFALVERTIAEYEEEVYRCKAESQRRQQLGSGVGIHWFSPDPRLMQTVPETPQIKEEPSELCLAREEELLPEGSL